jgi:Uma2 family endonuclease
MENLAHKFITETEYFQLEENSEVKHEYFDGEIFAMAGAKKNHHIIVMNLSIILGTYFKLKPCNVYPSDMRVSVEQGKYYTYPDLTVVCGKSEFLDKNETTLTNPNLILEVLSDSTEKYDRSKKFQSYRTIPSLNTYVLVSTEYKQIEVYSKNPNNSWTLTDPDENGKIHIPSIDYTLDLNEVYEKVEF